MSPLDDAAFLAAIGLSPPNGSVNALPTITIMPIEEFIAEDEPGATALVGGDDTALIPEGGDIMFYGDGGAGKTTLSIDLACHLAAGKDWLGIPVARPVRVLIIENEGPRPLFRKKLDRKVAAWPGPPINGGINVFKEPWGEFTFADTAWRTSIAATISEHEIDVLIAGPVTRTGMNEAGTLQQIRDFMALVGDVRKLSGRRLTVILIHHENKGGAVSGAWEGAGDTLLHVESPSNGFTRMTVQKARWSGEHHKTTFELVWTDGDGYALKAARDIGSEIDELLADGEWRTLVEIAASKDATSGGGPGVGANRRTVQDWLAGHPEVYESRTGDAAKKAGRHPSSTVWQTTRKVD